MPLPWSEPTAADGLVPRAIFVVVIILLRAILVYLICWLLAEANLLRRISIFEALFLAPPKLSTVRQLSVQLGVLPSTLMSRFFRSGLPAPKRYLAEARLVRAARLFENPGFSIANVANHLDYSSPQRPKCPCYPSNSRNLGRIWS